ncbi:rCG55297 [Rattus norvegicus]|uniref:RCG55297 n=1 Tax=Rattus norvegicus TaxID=10116 RepID=A6J834_RAT|nr:rCG55297 [Rattus norvegicus]
MRTFTQSPGTFKDFSFGEELKESFVWFGLFLVFNQQMVKFILTAPSVSCAIKMPIDC